MQILNIIAGLAILVSSATSTAIAEGINQPNVEVIEIPNQTLEMGSNSIVSMIIEKSLAKGLSEAKIGQIIATVACESQFQSVQSRIVKHGVQEPSYGIAQINIPAHPDITIEQALDVDFATTFIVNEFALGHEKKWTCARKLGFVD